MMRKIFIAYLAFIAIYAVSQMNMEILLPVLLAVSMIVTAWVTPLLFPACATTTAFKQIMCLFFMCMGAQYLSVIGEGDIPLSFQMFNIFPSVICIIIFFWYVSVNVPVEKAVPALEVGYIDPNIIQTVKKQTRYYEIYNHVVEYFPEAKAAALL